MASNTPPADDIGLEEKPTPASADTMQEPAKAAVAAGRAPRRAARTARTTRKVAVAAAEAVPNPVKRSPVPRKRAAAKPAPASAEAKPASPKRRATGRSGSNAKTTSLNLPVSAKGLVGMAATIGVVAAGLTAAIGRKRIAKTLSKSTGKSGTRRKTGRGKA
jgi:hypothetical protein